MGRSHRTDEQILTEFLSLTNGQLIYPTERTLRAKLRVDAPKMAKLLKYALRKKLIKLAEGGRYATMTESDRLALQRFRELRNTVLRVDGDLERPLNKQRGTFASAYLHASPTRPEGDPK